jgi:hypothetical protein
MHQALSAKTNSRPSSFVKGLGSRLDDWITNLSLAGLAFYLAAFLIYAIALDFGVIAPAQHDFVCYWTSAKLLVAHANPFDSQTIFHMEQVLGTNHSGQPFVMRNFPWTLLFVAPLGFLSLKVAAFWWTAVLLALSILSLRLMNAPRVAWFFMPLLVCSAYGQSTVIPLVGTVLFFRLRENRPALAGLALVLLTIKPHLFVLFWPILLIECFQRRSFRIFYLAAPVFLAMVGVITYLDPHVWTQYVVMMRGEHIGSQFLPNISCAVRMFISPRNAWIQLLPTCAGLIWAIMYYLRRRKNWDWNTDGALLIAISTLVSPYSWYYDQTMFLPSIAQVTRRDGRNFSFLLTMTFLPLAFIASGISWKSPAFALCAAVWFVWHIAQQIRSKGRFLGRRASAVPPSQLEDQAEHA